MEKIKLVIWDLDETFWKGTLSEEGIIKQDDNIEIIKVLTSRGIINSIVSKNDYEDAKQKLIELGVWEYFIFPQISWSPKGPIIKELINRTQLRDVNVLFLDDNHLNLEEAKYYNPLLNIETPEFIPELLDHPSLSGKNDFGHSRLKQYKILEEKHVESLRYGNNTDFLRDSNINIQLIHGDELFKHIDRITELVERTNQLNFTKIRINKNEISDLLKDTDYKSAIIKVVDRFGDYGIVGFYSLKISEPVLQHFVFSCRILNLGVVQYVYSKLGNPKLNIIPDVAEELVGEVEPNWITENVTTSLVSSPKLKEKNEDQPTIFFKGGCDLGQMLYYLNEKGFSFIEETNYVSQNNFPIHVEHTQVLIDSIELSEKEKQSILSKKYIPFIDKNFYSTKVFDSKYDCLVYSVLMDYTQEIYNHKELNIKIPHGGYHSIWTKEENKDEIVQNSKRKGVTILEDTISTFIENFEHLGQITEEDFIQNLHKIRSLVPINIPIVFINGSEVQSKNEREKQAQQRHVEMNFALDQFIENSENTYLIDIRKIVLKTEQTTNNIRHYNRETYRKISIELLKFLNAKISNEISTKISLRIDLKAKLLNSKTIRKIRKVINR